MTKSMVLGGAGFIGSHLVDTLLAEGDLVCVVDNLFLGKTSNLPSSIMFAEIDASNPIVLGGVIRDVQPDTIYNLAVMPLPHSLEHPRENVLRNIEIVQNVCEELRRGMVKRLVHFSSSEVYGSAEYEPMCENHPWKASTPYAASKAAGDLICLSYVKTFDCDISIIRPFNNYGPRQNSGAYAGIIPLTIRRILDHEDLVIYGDGNQTRDYIFVKDTARAAVMMGKRDDLKGQIINIASGHDYSMNWLVREIQLLMSSILINRNYEMETSPIDYQPARPGDVRRHIANVLKAKDLLGFEHTTSMANGLKQTIEFYLEK